jgi:serine/threonine protein phosphatase PrpC
MTDQHAAAPGSRDGAPFLFIDQDMEEIELVPMAGGTAAVISQRSPIKDSPNEDAVALIPLADDHGVLIVADGVGGLPAGDRAARIAVEELTRAILDGHAAHDPTPPVGEVATLRATIVAGIESANRAVLAAGTGATTLAVAEIHASFVRSYHVGDSTILLTGQRGRVKMQTIAHSPVGYAVESGLLGEDEAMVHEDRHLVSNMLGTSEMRIELGPAIALAPRDTLLVATDGLSDNVFATEIVDLIRKGALAGAAGDLRDLCRRRMLEAVEGQPSKADDMSFVAFRLVVGGRPRRRG